MLPFPMALAALVAASPVSATLDLDRMHFVEIKSFQEKEGLPPKLTVTFDLNCNEEFVRVIREEDFWPRSQLTSIYVGVLVKTQYYSSCVGQKKSMTVDAGTTFSGRAYQVKLIKAGPDENLVVKDPKKLPAKK